MKKLFILSVLAFSCQKQEQLDYKTFTIINNIDVYMRVTDCNSENCALSVDLQKGEAQASLLVPSKYTQHFVLKNTEETKREYKKGRLRNFGQWGQQTYMLHFYDNYPGYHILMVKYEMIRNGKPYEYYIINETSKFPEMKFLFAMEYNYNQGIPSYGEIKKIIGQKLGVH